MIYECQNCRDLFEEPRIYETYTYDEREGCPSCANGDFVEITQAHPAYQAIYREYIKSRVEEEG